MMNGTDLDMEPIGPGGTYEKYDRMWQRVAPQSASPAIQRTKLPAKKDPVPELQLPGAEENPCCMGTEAAELTEVLSGFAREEAEDAAAYAQIARFAPNRMAASVLRELSREAEHRCRELGAALYLITGENRPAGHGAVILPRVPYRELLRGSYHAAACNALNYARAEEGTGDPCLGRLFRRFSRENEAAADRLLELLAQSR